MALSDSEILDIWSPGLSRPILGKTKVLHFARAIEAEVRKADTKLIRQMLEALCLLESADVVLTECGWEVTNAAITAARARLEQS
jgi:hypothetical protein